MEYRPFLLELGVGQVVKHYQIHEPHSRRFRFLFARSFIWEYRPFFPSK